MRKLIKSLFIRTLQYPPMPNIFGIYLDILMVQIQEVKSLVVLKRLCEIRKIIDLQHEKLYLLEISGERKSIRKIIRIMAMKNIKIMQAYFNVGYVKW